MHSLTYESDSSTEPLTTVLPASCFVEVVTWKNEEKVRQTLRFLSGRMQNFLWWTLMDLQQTIKTEVKYSASPICSSTRLCLITNLRFLHFSTLQFKLKYYYSSFWNTFSFISSNNWQSIKAHPHSIFLVMMSGISEKQNWKWEYCTLLFPGSGDDSHWGLIKM